MDNLPRRAAVRIETQDGPWSVSVAETPHDPRSYCLYIKTPTHNLTLTRTAMEILDLDAKLRDSDANAKIPLLPFTADSIPQPPKRKSTFLNTLSRLASPTANKTARRTPNPPPVTLPTPIASPAGEINDPFSSFGASNVNSPSVVPTPSTTSTGLAAYLTTVSNSSTLRQTRVWKRFVRVRTDDLESVRPEKAIKRVRSDLAAHVGGLPGQKDGLDPQDLVPSSDQPLPEEDSLPTPVQSPKELDVDDDDARNEPHAQVTERAKPDAIIDEVKNQEEPAAVEQQPVSSEVEPSTEAPVAPEDIPVPTTPTASEPQAQAQAQPAGTAASPPSSQQQQQRVPRSRSADPDKSSRLSRAFAQSAPANDHPATSATPEMDGDNISSATGDESSVSTSNPKRKKRSKSTTTPREKKYKDKEPKKSQRKVIINDFEMMRVLGKGCAGKVLLVRHRQTSDLYALKAITKRHVLAHQELQHTLTEQAVLKRMAAEGKDPFVVKLWWSFHDKENLFLVMDFHPGGDLATQLARWGRLGRDRARFYAAEIVEGVEGLHAAGVIYRDLKPENILIGSDGHIVLTDFGLSKEFPRRNPTSGASVPMTPQQEITASAAWMNSGNGSNSPTPGTPGSDQVVNGWPGQSIGLGDQTTTFCGTAEYLAPEVIQGLPYSYEVDWWSFGTMLYEMLTGITPFWANNHSDMYVRVLQDELQFPEDRAMDQDTKSLIRGLLQRNPGLRICEPRIKRHPYFSMIDWSHVYYKRYIPPYIPPIDPSNASDTQNFDDTFLDMEPVLDEYVDQDQDQGQTTDTDAEGHTDTDRTDGEGDWDEDTGTTPSQSRSSSIRAGTAGQRGKQEEGVDVFDGYSFKGRHSVLIDSSDEEEEEEEEEEDEDEEEVLGSVVTPPETARPASSIVDGEGEEGEEGEVPEPKTPEARPLTLSPTTSPAPPSVVNSTTITPRRVEEDDKEKEEIERLVANAKELEHKLEEGEPITPTEDKPKGGKSLLFDIPSSKPPTSTAAAATTVAQQQKQIILRSQITTTKIKQRRERSGVPALDKDLPEDTEAGEDTEAIGDSLDDEDDDWDFIDAVDGEDRNGTKGTSLFARGVVDRYRLAVFRKASTPSRSVQQQREREQREQRAVGGMAGASSKKKKGSGDVDDVEGGEGSPTQKRGRSALAFGRKGPRQFLQPKSEKRNVSTPTQSTPPPPPPSTSTATTATQASPVVTSSSAAGLLTPSLSMGSSAVMSLSLSPSLKSRESAVSVGGAAEESDVSNGGGVGGSNTAAGGVNGDMEQALGGGEKMKATKKLRKYKEGAEKVFSLFSGAAPRQHHTS
ncbi:hypothetical protein AN958_11830 [Leucoagaricus sp. SymC.cos]|nr:hypothetical protein AN958_11830 [Leucoagaricus sp. SymC.cos]